ncbi:MAG: carboxy-S-adenosyl-L-methionine synthase CmoA [Gammaproteobacteria bacterium]|nr:carboxy-S-adenosyl-L-methionine synthase CmoA [Gammaproteobacteria bacterium]
MAKKDKIFEEGNVSCLPFSFNQEVTEVFEDMIDRSVPGYITTLNIIEQQSKKHSRENTNIYDLGCSLGASTASIINGVEGRAKIIGIDSSESMIMSCNTKFSNLIEEGVVEFLNEDICNSVIQNASIVVINFVLQFLELSERQKLMKKIYEGLNPDGILLLSEKVHFESERETAEISKIHHSFKSKNGYSELEISGKRDSLEGVLITETEKQHIKRLEEVGFINPIKLMFDLNFLTYKFEKQ